MSSTKDNQTDIIEFANSSDRPPEKNEGTIISNSGNVVTLGEKGKK